MPLTEEQIDDLRDQIAVARKRTLNFGLCIGGDAESTVLVAHRRKAPDVLAKAARKAGGSAKVAFGSLRVEGKELILTCAEDPPAGTARRAKELLRAVGLKMKVTLAAAPDE
jgi:hypothetical protein